MIETTDKRFTIFPAVDLKAGEAVRLLHGDYDAVTRYDADPTGPARRFAAAGFRHLHVVDLDGALAGESRNGAAVDAILKNFQGRVQTGGGVRTEAQVDAWLDKGVWRVVIGTMAVRDPDFAAGLAARRPGRIVVALDGREGRVAAAGWTETTNVKAVDLAKRFEDAGVAAFLYTDVDRDGALSGPNLEATAALAEAVKVPVLASGGVARMEDLEALSALPLAGAVVGRAFYEETVTPEAAAARFVA